MAAKFGSRVIELENGMPTTSQQTSTLGGNGLLYRGWIHFHD
jgi:hypothetical protein